MEFIESLTISSYNKDYQHLAHAIKGRFEFDFSNNIDENDDSNSNRTIRQGQLLMWDDGDYIDVDRLKNLTLSNVKLVHLDGIVLPFQNLITLNLSFNKLTGDLIGIRHIKSLKLLDISHNKLQLITEVKYLISLEILRLHNNQIESLESICYLNKLEELWFSDNKITWGEFIYLLNLKELKCLVQKGNPSDEKPKIKDFICGLIPSLHILDGSMIPRKSLRAEFLRTNDGKVMLTQARAMLSKEQKELLGNVEHENVITERRVSSSPSRINSPQNSLTPRSPRQHRFVSPIALSSTPPSDNFSLDTSRSVNSNSRNRLGPKIQRFKVKKKEITNDNYSIPNEDNLIENETYEKPVDHSHTEPIQIIRFGESNDAPVAFSLNEDGSGYARWSKNGPIACSMDGGRMLASYRGGAIAGILDRTGAGSVMDTRGRCVLILSEQGIAKVLDKNGVIISQHTKSKEESQSPNDKSVHRWKFDGLRFEFFPSTWELKVRVKTEKLMCDFSNLSGCKLVEEISQTKHSNERQKLDPLDSNQHEKLRDGLHDVVSKLDELLVGIKDKGKPPKKK